MSENYSELKRRRDEISSQVNQAQEALSAQGDGDRADLEALESQLARAQAQMHELVQLERNALYRMGDLLDGLQRDLSEGHPATEEQIRLHAEIQNEAILAVESQKENPEVTRLGEMLLERCAALGDSMSRRQ